ncbi:MAG: hypothetical protein HY519_03240, partial [Candidatus Aenigmarchaeota archaeon]|nr:hypothetical protein [Candidatus Aenigmarchaeota archaeon]
MIIPFLAYKDLARDRKIVLLVVFLLAFSYVNLTFFAAFLHGLSDTFQNEAVDTSTSHILIEPRLESGSRYLEFAASTRKKIDLVPGVIGSSSHVQAPASILYRGAQFGARIIGLDPEADQTVTTVSAKVLKGEFLSGGHDDEVVLGEIIAGRTIEDTMGGAVGFGQAIEGLGGVSPGEKVRIRFANGVEKEYRVRGIVGTPGFSEVSQSVYITKKEAESVLGLHDQASAILVRLRDKSEAGRYKQLILELGIPNAKVQTW